MNRGESLTSKIAIGTRGHFSIGNISEKGEFGGGVHHIEVVAGGKVDKQTGMIIDFKHMKDAVSGVLNDGFEHGFVVPQGSGKLIQKCRQEGMNIIETPEGSLEGLPIMIFDRMRLALREPTHLRLIRLQAVPGSIHQIEADNEGIKVGKMSAPKRRSTWECYLHFGHRIIGLGKCETPHTHSWKPKIKFSRELTPEEYKRITGKIEVKLKKSWNGRGIFHASDDFSDFLKLQKNAKIKQLASPPTTEIISMAMIREIENVLRSEGTDIKLTHFELWETPTNFVTT